MVIWNVLVFHIRQLCIFALIYFQSTIELHAIPRGEPADNKDMEDRWQHFSSVSDRWNKAQVPVVYLPECGQIVRAVPVWQVPLEVYPKGEVLFLAIGWASD